MRVTPKVTEGVVSLVPKGINTPIRAVGNLGRRLPTKADETSLRAPGTGCPMQVTIGVEVVKGAMIPKGAAKNATNEVS